MSKKKSNKHYGATTMHDCCVGGYSVKEAKSRVKEAKRAIKLAVELFDTGIVMYEDQAAIIGKAYLRVRDAKQDLERAKERE